MNAIFWWQSKEKNKHGQKAGEYISRKIIACYFRVKACAK